MSIATAASGTADVGPHGRGVERTDIRPDERGGPGSTTIDEGVVEKIASYAVAQVDQVGGTANRFLGIAVGPDTASRSPKVNATVDGTAVTLQVRCSIIYPAPVGKVTRQIRAHVVERLSTLTGLSPRVVDIVVTALHTPDTTRRSLS